MIGQLTGNAHTWELFDQKRTFGEVTIPFSQAREYIVAFRYNALNGKGQQREIVESHLKKIKSAMQEGTFTPTPASANLSKEHQQSLTVKDGQFSLGVTSDNPLYQTDAGHRFEAMSRIVKELEEKVGVAKDKEKTDAERWLAQVLALPVTITLYFDGDAQSDFVNLQLGRAVDSSHLLSLKVQKKIVDDPSFKLAFEIAKVLNKVEASPFKGAIRFDSRGAVGLPISTICSGGSSDIGTSLVGLARVGNGKKADFLAGCVIEAFKALQKHDQDNEGEVGILDYGKMLTPLSAQGTKGSATMLVGVGACLAYRLITLGRNEATQHDLNKLVDAAKATLDQAVNGNFSGPVKRKLLGKFAQVFLADLDVDKHCKLPIGLLKFLSASTFGVEALPKAKKETKKKETKPKAEKKSRKKTLPDVDGPVEQSADPVFEEAFVPAGVDSWDETPDNAPWSDEIQG